MKYAYTLFEVRKSDAGVTSFDLLEQQPVDPATRDIVDLIRELRPWALERIAAHRGDLGLYDAVFSALDEDDEPCRSVSQQYLVWDGSTELTQLARARDGVML